jgi:hypothetical protein
VQTVLVQDEALKQANSHIQQLEQELGYGQEPQRPPGGFLDNMRSALFGKQEPAAPPPSPSRWGSVPSVRPGGAQGYPQEHQGWGPGPAGGAPMGGQYPGAAPMGGGFGGGGSFLGTAAASAAGVIGGSLMMDSIRSMMGHRGGTAHAAYEPAGAGQGSPWGGNSTSSDNKMAHDLGIDDIGRSSGSGGGAPHSYGVVDNDTSENAKTDYVSDDDANYVAGEQDDVNEFTDDSDFDDDVGGDGGGGDDE